MINYNIKYDVTRFGKVSVGLGLPHRNYLRNGDSINIVITTFRNLDLIFIAKDIQLALYE